MTAYYDVENCICCELGRSVILFDCKHRVYCEICFNGQLNENDLQFCPFCKVFDYKIDRSLRISQFRDDDNKPWGVKTVKQGVVNRMPVFAPAIERQIEIRQLFSELSQQLHNNQITDNYFLENIEYELNGKEKHWLYLESQTNTDLLQLYVDYERIKSVMERLVKSTKMYDDIILNFSKSFLESTSVPYIFGRAAASSGLDMIVTYFKHGSLQTGLTGEAIGGLFTFGVLCLIEWTNYCNHRNYELFIGCITEHFSGCVGSLVGTACTTALYSMFICSFPGIGGLIVALLGGLLGDFLGRSLSRVKTSEYCQNKMKLYQNEIDNTVQSFALVLGVNDIKSSNKSECKLKFREKIYLFHTDKQRADISAERKKELDEKAQELILAWHTVSKWFDERDGTSQSGEDRISVYVLFYLKRVRDNVGQWRTVCGFFSQQDAEDENGELVEYVPVEVEY